MHRLAEALRDDRPSLPIPWPILQRRLRVLPGSLIILLGAPGSGKSLFALCWALDICEQIPVRLVSMDTDSKTQAARTIAHLTGGLYESILDEPERWAGWLKERPLPIALHDQPVEVKDIDQMIRADTLWWGQTPGLVVVDDVVSLEFEKDYGGVDQAFRDLKNLAVKHHTVVLALHHVNRSGGGVDGDRAIKMSDGKFSGEYTAQIMLGLWAPNEETMRIQAIKNRFGEKGWNADLRVDFARSQISSWELNYGRVA